MKIRQIMIASLLLFSGTKALAQPERVSVWTDSEIMFIWMPV